MSGGAPRPSVNPSSLVLSAPGLSITTSLEVLNRGGGRLEATIESNVPWVVVDPTVIEENHVRVAVTVDTSALDEDHEAQATLTLRSGPLKLDIPLRVTRVGMERALRLYRDGHLPEAREACRDVAQTSDTADATLLIATTYLDEKNVPAAARPLLEATALLVRGRAEGKGEGLDFPQDVFDHFLDILASLLPQLRQARFTVGLLEQFLENGVAGRMGAEPKVTELLHQAATLFVTGFRPRVLPTDDLEASSGLVRRMQQRFSDDAQWEDWLQEARQTPEATEAVAQGPRARYARLFAALFVVAFIAAFSIVLLWPKANLNQARALLESGHYQEALEAVERARRNGLFDGKSASELRRQINFEWAKSLFSHGNRRDGADRLGRALAEDVDNPEMQAFKRLAYEKWADDALRKGEIREGCDALEVLSHTNPPDPRLIARNEAMRPMRELYNVLRHMAAAAQVRESTDFAPTIPMDLTGRPGVPEWARILREQGIAWYDARLQVAFVNLFNDGRQQIVLAGNDRERRCGFHVYAPEIPGFTEGSPSPGLLASPRPGTSPRMRELLVWRGDGELLDRMQQVSLERGTRRTGLIIDFVRGAASPLGHGVLLWGDNKGLRQWTPPDAVTPIEVSDADHNGLPELWARRVVGENADPSVAALLPIPYQWMPAGPEMVARAQEEYYHGTYLPQLRTELARNPFPPGDPRHKEYAGSREKASALVVKMLGR